MNEEENVRKIAISQETFEKLSEDFIKNLKQEQHVVLVVLPREEIFDRYLSGKNKDVSGIILDKEEEETFEKRQQNLMKYAEQIIVNIPPLPDMKELYPRPSKKQKYYVPHTIGTPNSKKKGGR